MEKGTIERVDVSTVDVRAHGKYIANVRLTSGVDIETLSVGDSVLIEGVDGKYYVVTVIEKAAGAPEDALATWIPRPPVSLEATHVGSVAHFTWDWGDSTKMLKYLKSYWINVRESGGTWGYGPFPLSTGTAEEFTYDFSGSSAKSFEWRVIAISVYKTRSEAVSSTIDISDTTPPPAPSSVIVNPAVNGVNVSWSISQVTKEDVLKPAAFYTVYRATDSDGTGAAAVATAGGLSAFVSCASGEEYYYNVTASDEDGNESDYAETVWVFGVPTYTDGINFLTNADFERDFDSDGVADDWWDVAGTLGAYGIGGGQGYQLSAPVRGVFLGVSYAVWDPAENGRLTKALEGQYLIFSAHVKYISGESFSPLKSGGGKAYFTPGFFFSDGATTWTGNYIDIEADDYQGYEALADGWYRVWGRHRVTASDITGLPYVGVAIILQNASTTTPAVCYVDRVKVEFGYEPSQWTPGLVPAVSSGLDSISIDTAGIVSASFKLTAAGKVASGILANSDNAYDVGDATNKFKDLYLAGDASYEGDLKPVRDSTEYTGQVVINKGHEMGSGDVTLSTSAQDCISKTVTVPGGATLRIYNAISTIRCTSFSTAVTAYAEIYIGSTRFTGSFTPVAQWQRGNILLAYQYTPATEVSVTFKIRAWKSDTANTLVWLNGQSCMDWDIIA